MLVFIRYHPIQVAARNPYATVIAEILLAHRERRLTPGSYEQPIPADAAPPALTAARRGYAAAGAAVLAKWMGLVGIKAPRALPRLPFECLVRACVCPVEAPRSSFECPPQCRARVVRISVGAVLPSASTISPGGHYPVAKVRLRLLIPATRHPAGVSWAARPPISTSTTCAPGTGNRHFERRASNIAGPTTSGNPSAAATVRVPDAPAMTHHLAPCSWWASSYAAAATS